MIRQPLPPHMDFAFMSEDLVAPPRQGAARRGPRPTLDDLHLAMTQAAPKDRRPEPWRTVVLRRSQMKAITEMMVDFARRARPDIGEAGMSVESRCSWLRPRSAVERELGVEPDTLSLDELDQRAAEAFGVAALTLEDADARDAIRSVNDAASMVAHGRSPEIDSVAMREGVATIPRAPEAQERMLESLTAYAGGLRLARSPITPFGSTQDSQGKVSIIAPERRHEGIEEDLVDALRLSCIRAGAVATALVCERSEIDTTSPETQASVERWQARGKDLSKHPETRRVILVVVASETGVLSQALDVEEAHGGGHRLVARSARFTLWDGDHYVEPFLLETYVRTADRLRVDVRREIEENAKDIAFHLPGEPIATVHN